MRAPRFELTANRHRSSWPTLVSAASVVISAQAVVVGFCGTHSLGPVVSDLLQLLLGIFCLMAAWGAFRRSGKVTRYYWRMLVLTFILWSIAQVLATYVDTFGVVSLNALDDMLFSFSTVPMGMLLFHPKKSKEESSKLLRRAILQCLASMAAPDWA